MVEEALYRRNAFHRALQKVGNKYALVNIIAKRAHDLAAGAPPMIRTRTTNLHIVAAEEIAADKIRITPPRKEEEDEGVA